MGMEYKIYVGTLLKIKKGFFKGTFNIMYCGMVNDNTFALSPFKVHGYQGFSPNVFYNLNATIIHLLDREFEVLEVTPDYIILAD